MIKSGNVIMITQTSPLSFMIFYIAIFSGGGGHAAIIDTIKLCLGIDFKLEEKKVRNIGR